MTERPQSEAELDAQLDAIEGLLGAYPRAMLALRQVRQERDAWKQVQADTLKAQIVADHEVVRLRAANAALREALKGCIREMISAAQSDYTGADDYHEALEVAERALASSAPETP
jgi:hypothetical protein